MDRAESGLPGCGLVYADEDASVLPAARQTVAAQLAYLADRSTAG